MAERHVDLRLLLQRALDSLLAGGEPADLELVLLRSDHTLRAQERQVDDLRQALARHVDELQLRVDQLAALRALGDLLETWTDSDALFDQLPGHLRQIFRADSVSLYLLDPERRHLEIVGADPANDPENDRPLPLDRGIAGWVVRQARSRLVADCRQDPVFQERFQPETAAEGHLPGTLLCAPLKVAGHVLGVVHVSLLATGQLDGEDQNLLDLLNKVRLPELARADIYRDGQFPGA